MSNLRILLADDHDVVRQGLRALLQSRAGWEICGEATTGREAVALAKEKQPDVVVLDFSMPELNGLEAARQIRAALPGTEVLILTVYDSDRLASEFLAAGARGYVLKADAGKYIIQAVECLALHKPYLSARVSDQVLGTLTADKSASDRSGSWLTAREREILRLVAEGRSNKQIADQLTISIHTVETHRNNIMQKLDIHSVAELVRYAIRNGLAEP